ncbi:MAG: LysR family transcriptional regulator, partial [Candidatus Kapaibacterium sp.]
ELESNALHIIKVKGFPITSTWRLVWLASKRLSPAAAAFLETMTNDRQRIVRRHFAWMNRYE